MKRLRVFAAAAVVFSLVACGGDAGFARDAGAPEADGGGGGDAGLLDVDGGDAGLASSADDGGARVDAGPVPPDAGGSDDAGASDLDGGAGAGDAGVGGASDGGAALPSFCGRREPARSAGGWEIVCGDVSPGHLLGVWGSSEHDVYFVGGVGSTTTILHWDGTALAKMSNPGRAKAWWVFGTDPDHVYVVGERGLGLQRLFGGDWVPFATGTQQTIFGIWGPTPDDLFFVTGDANAAAPPHIFRRRAIAADGGLATPTLVEQTLPATATRSYFKVWGTSASNVMAVGERGTILRFDGATWNIMPTPYEAALLTITGTTAGDAYVVGGASQGTLWRLAEGAWRDVSLPEGTPALMGVVSEGGGRADVSGVGGFAARLDDARLMPDGRMSHDDLHAVFATHDSVWAVGGNLFSSESPAGIVMRRARAEPPCPPGGLLTPGVHHLDFQGRLGTPNRDGTYPMFAEARRGAIDPRLVHGEHYLLGRGAFAQWSAPLCASVRMRKPHGQWNCVN